MKTMSAFLDMNILRSFIEEKELEHKNNIMNVEELTQELQKLKLKLIESEKTINELSKRIVALEAENNNIKQVRRVTFKDKINLK